MEADPLRRDRTVRGGLSSPFRVGEWAVTPDKARIEGPAGEVRLGAPAMAVLTELSSFAGEVRTRQQLFEAVWPGESVHSAALAEAVAELRRALGDDPAAPRYVEEVAGRGYRLVASVSWPGLDEGTDERFEIEDQVGGGGMGVVYRAIDPRLGRTVALKFLLQEWGRNPTAKERFLVEARAAAALDHPNICPVHEIAETAEGRMFLVMPFYDGGSLADRLGNGPLDPREATRIVVEAARGLAHAHAAGIVHRDIKPANLMFAANGAVKVLDFGIAKLADVQGLTVTGALVGTPAYMSPEQVYGSEIDLRTDIWSLGVVLSEMLTGRRPFAGSNHHSVLHAVLYGEIDLEIPEVPGPLSRVLGRMLERDPKRRYASCEELLRDLEPQTRTTSTAATPILFTELPNRPAAPVRRWRRPALWGAGLAAAGLVAWLVSQSAIAPPSPIAPTPSETSAAGSTPVELARSARDHLARHYDESEVETAIRYFEDALRLDGEYAPAYAGLAEAYRRMHDVNRDGVQLSRALASAERAVDLNPYLAAAHTSLGLVLVVTGEPERGERELRKALELDPLSAATHRELGIALHRLQEVEAAEASFERALELDPEDWWTWTQVGVLAFGDGRYADAEEAFRRSTEITPQNPVAFRNLAGAMQMQDRYEEAAAALQQSLAIRPLDSTYSNLGTLLFAQGKFGDAVNAFERAVDLGPNNHIYWGNLGDAYRWAPGRRDDARAAFERAAALAREALAADPNDVSVRSRLALFYAKAGDAAHAIETLDEVLAEGTPDANGWYRALLTYELVGQRERALDALSRALDTGYPLEEIEREPELIELRRDRRYHETVARAA